MNILAVGALVALGGGTFAISQNQNKMEHSLQAQIVENPRLPVATWADIQIEARDVTLNGVTTDSNELRQLVDGLGAMPEIASIENNVKLAPIADPFEFVAKIADGQVVINGHMPSAEMQKEFLSQLDENVIATFDLASGGPAARDWRDVLTYSTRLINHFDQGEIRVAGLEVSFVGRAGDHQSFSDLDLIANAGFPDNLKRGSTEIIAPFEDNFVLQGGMDDNVLTLNGFVPSKALRTELQSLGADVSNLLVASGASDGFENDAQLLTNQLLNLGEGSFALGEDRLEFSSQTNDFELFDQTIDQLNTIKRAAIDIDFPLPTIAPFTFEVKQVGTTKFATGYMPENMREFELLQGVDQTSLRAANGAPANFDEVAAWIADSEVFLANDWRLAFEGDEMNVQGQAKTPQAYVDLLAHAAQPPEGITIDLTNLDLAVADPYIWSLDKSGNGDVKMAGYLPDSQLRQTIYAVLDTSADDTTLLAAGAPEEFGTLVTLAAKTINVADSGEAIYDQLGWRTDVTARDLFNKNNILQQFSNEEIQPTRLGLKVAQLPPPLQDPYRFSVEKQSDGTRQFEGFVPTEAMLINLADQGALDLELAQGAPEQFEEFVALGNSILSGLERGTLSFAGDKWNLEGTTDSFEAKQKLMQQIEAAGLSDDVWTIEITSPAQTISPYLFSAEKMLDGDMSASGYAPNRELIDQWADDYGWRAQLQVGAGAPETFLERAMIGLNALELLDAGRLSLVDGQWALIGRAASDANLAAVLEVLAAHSDSFLVDVQVIQPIDQLSLQIRKDSEGQFEWSGYLADETYWEQGQSLPIAKPNILPERAEFNQMTALGIDALKLLDSGEMVHAGGQWSISGQAPDRAVRSAVKLMLSGAPLGPWYTTLTTPVVEEVVDEAAASADETDMSADSESGADTPAADAQDENMGDATEAADADSLQTEPETMDSSDEEMSTDEAEDSNSDVDSTEEMTDAVEQEVESDGGEATSTDEVADEGDQSETTTDQSDAIESDEATEAATEELASQGDEAAETTETNASSEQPMEAEEVKDNAPIATFETQIAKSSTGIAISGNVPDAASRYALELSAGDGAKLDVVEADGAPERFLADALTVAQALSAADSGEATLNEGQWIVSGKVSSFEAGDQFEAVLAALPNARITIDMPPAHKLCNANVEQLIADQAILFQSGSARITPGSQAVLEKIAAQLSNCPQSVVEVEGHTDADGDDLINLSLSVQRAETVVSELIELGVEANRLYALGFGETLPIADNNTRSGKAQNRRIVFTVRPPLE
ncbi:OmpA family protein [Maritalea sp. S77]|uniref:OmpA family protein n=1 Tax=Maritalea sp. S77 TaxID=3415125 RepID=UPI003C79D7D8